MRACLVVTSLVAMTTSQPYTLTPQRPPAMRLLRLILMLALVLAAMHQLQDPQLFQALFPNPDDRPPLSPQTLAEVPLLTAGPDTRPLLADSDDGDVALRLQVSQTLSELSDGDIIALIGELAAFRPTDRPQPAEPLPSTPRTWSDDWLRQLDQAYGQAATRQNPPQSASPPNWQSPEIIAALQDAADDWLIDHTDPAAVWTGRDRLAFYRLLANPPPKRRTSPASVASAVALIQQPEVYLRRRVVLRGSVARCSHPTRDRSTASSSGDSPAIDSSADDSTNPFGVADYLEVWIRPDDGSARPVVIYTTSVPDSIAAVAADSTEPSGPDVVIDGVYLKRIAYQSMAGRELAPAIVGDIHLIQAPAAATADPAIAVPAATLGRRQGWIVILGTALFGVGLATLLVWQANQARRRSRQQRIRHQEPLDLS